MKKIKLSKRRSVSPCGTNAAYERHRRSGEKPCEECRAAHNERMAEWRNETARKRKKKRKKRHGTNAAYQRHRRQGENPCQECCDAHSEYMNEWRRSKRDGS